MYPNQQPTFPAPPPPAGNNYDFIMNPQQPSRGPLLKGLGGNSFMVKLAFIIGGAILAMIVLTVLVNLFFGSKTNTADIVLLTQTQQELVRVSGMGDDADSQAVKNAAKNTEVSINSQQQTWLRYLAEQGRKVEDKELGLKQDTTTDAKLKSAQQTSTFDTTFTAQVRSQLTAYNTQLKSAYDRTGDKAQRDLLSKQYDEVLLLLKQWPE